MTREVCEGFNPRSRTRPVLQLAGVLARHLAHAAEADVATVEAVARARHREQVARAGRSSHHRLTPPVVRAALAVARLARAVDGLRAGSAHAEPAVGAAGRTVRAGRHAVRAQLVLDRRRAAQA